MLNCHTLYEYYASNIEEDYANVRKVMEINDIKLNYYISEFWSSKQRQALSIHEISYRACFKPQLPSFFIKKLTKKDSIVFDPFIGRGTTIVESVLNGRVAIGMDINPLSEILTYPRINIPKVSEIFDRLESIQLDKSERIEPTIDLSMFFHGKTLSEIINLRDYLTYKKEAGKEDVVDKWIRMVATNRLTGHSSGFFSVYTLPPNQATSPSEQIKINKKRNQEPEYRDVKKIIRKKTLSLLRDFEDENVVKHINEVGKKSKLIIDDARYASKYISKDSIDLTVTSPPFLNIVQYAKDNWLRFWFNNIDMDKIEKRIFTTNNLGAWRNFIKEVLSQLFIITKKGGYVAFEVGEVKNGTINLDEYVAMDGLSVGFEVIGIFINKQEFTKTANIWGIKNSQKGTNTNRIVLFRRAD